jgi:uncharacterized protein YjiK
MQVKLSILLLSCITACSQENNKTMLYERPGYIFPYQLNEPGQSWKLPPELAEISGLSCIDGQRLACVQDENGIIYIFDLKSGEVESKIEFSDDGDYEGIEIIDKDAWVLKSNGTLFRITDFLEKKGSVVKKFSTELSGKNDTEGLAYDPVNKSLLIACKEHPFLDESEGNNAKAIYSFNLESGKLDLKPFLMINPGTVESHTGKVSLKPSGMAIHPNTGDIFILGSAGKLLLVLSNTGEIQAMIKLSPMIFPQPEGICFSPDGKLFIASEGGGRGGTIMEFEPKNK